MPNRILKESVCVSESIHRLSWFEEVLFYRLIVSCDDYGRYDGRGVVIRNRLFPLEEELTTAEVEAALASLAAAGLAYRYEAAGKPYLYLPGWADHQNVRAKRSRYPAPPGQDTPSGAGLSEVPAPAPEPDRYAAQEPDRYAAPEQGAAPAAAGESAPERICAQMYADAPVIQSGSVSSSSSVSFSASAPVYASEAFGGETEKKEARLPLKGGGEYTVPFCTVRSLASLFPGLDVWREFGRMRRWCLANPDRQKTEKEVERFFYGWLSRAGSAAGAAYAARCGERTGRGRAPVGPAQTGEARASYDLARAERLARTTVPQLKKRRAAVPCGGGPAAPFFAGAAV